MGPRNEEMGPRNEGNGSLQAVGTNRLEEVCGLALQQRSSAAATTSVGTWKGLTSRLEEACGLALSSSSAAAAAAAVLNLFIPCFLTRFPPRPK